MLKEHVDRITIVASQYICTVGDKVMRAVGQAIKGPFEVISIGKQGGSIKIKSQSGYFDTVSFDEQYQLMPYIAPKN